MPRQSDRAILCGQTGSGKTTLAEMLLREFYYQGKYIVVYDAKGMIDWSGVEIHSTFDTLVKSDHRFLVYCPTIQEINFAFQEKFFEWVYLCGNRVLYVDEVYSVARGDVYPQYYHACITRGREKGITTLSSTQRPKRIPQTILSESEHGYFFTLTLPQDRKAIYDCYGVIDVPEQKTYFAYYNQFTGETVSPLRLSL